MSIYDTLNPEQKRAVFHDKGPLLILAGAGSGKTRVLTHRIAYLIEEYDVNPYHILAITFTNKAAKEMRERVDALIGFGSEDVLVSTFHSMCVRFLRRDIEALGYERSFTIYDTDDQKTLMREVCKYLDIDTKQTKERTFINAISAAKNELISPEEYDARALGDYTRQKISRVYTEYQKRLKQNNALDFDDLIMKTVELFQNYPEILRKYQNRFRYIMVDEYQDTNRAQFELVRLMASTVNDEGQVEHNLCVVGDDDQSIYKFRGADIRNILDFEFYFPDTKVIRLEQNYRSTKTILEAANQVIQHNDERKAKTLWTDNEDGAPIVYNHYETDLEEARATAKDIRALSENSIRYSDIAILYRTNAQSRALEEQMILSGIPYKLVGGVNFYERREIKDILAYLKTIDNGADGIALKRIINVPKRSIGLATLDKVQVYADERGFNFYEALLHTESIPTLNKKTATTLLNFIEMLEGLRQHAALPEYSVKDIIDELLEVTGYRDYIQTIAETDDEYRERIANIDELINKAVLFDETSLEPPTLSSFLEEVALVADIDNLDGDTDAVTLMTLHSAKGLEFPCVFICGMEDGVFPSGLAINADNPKAEIEEERRLCYVGITRAMKQLTLSSASKRMMRGELQYSKESRFISEIPRFLLTEKKHRNHSYISERSMPSGTLRQATLSSPSEPRMRSFTDNSTVFDKPKPSLPPVKQFSGAGLSGLSYTKGDSVRHLKFGIGTVLDITEGGKDYEVTVEFPGYGVRKLLASFAKLQKV